MSNVSTNEFKTGMKIELDREPYTIVGIEFVKPGKGQAFTRTKRKHLMSGRVIEKNFKSGEKFPVADVEEMKMRMLYKEQEDAVFMHDVTFEQIHVPLSVIGDNEKWLMEEIPYDLVLYKGNVVDLTPPTFLSMKITKTDPGIRGDTASGRVLKPAMTETGAKIQVPIFVNEGETIKVDTRTGEYVSRV